MDQPKVIFKSSNEMAFKLPELYKYKDDSKNEDLKSKSNKVYPNFLYIKIVICLKGLNYLRNLRKNLMCQILILMLK